MVYHNFFNTCIFFIQYWYEKYSYSTGTAEDPSYDLPVFKRAVLLCRVCLTCATLAAVIPSAWSWSTLPSTGITYP